MKFKNTRGVQLNGLHASFFYKITYCNLLHFLKISILHIIAMLCIILSTALLTCIHIRTSLCTTLSTALGIHFSTGMPYSVRPWQNLR